MGRFNPDRRRHQQAKDARIRLTNDVMVRAMTLENVLAELARFTSSAEPHEFRQTFSKLLNKDRIRQALLLKMESVSDLAEKRSFAAPDDRLLDMYEAMIKNQSAMLKDFMLLRAAFESQLLTGQYEQALQTLDEIRICSGESLWLIRHRLLALSKAGRLDEMNSYARQCQEQCDEPLTRLLIDNFLLVTSDPVTQVDQTIAPHIAELADGRADHWADFLKLNFVPFPLMGKGQKLSCISVVQSFSLVDLVILLDQLLRNNLAIEALPAENKRERSLYELISSLRPTTDSAQYRSFVEHYETGNYDECRKLFLQTLNSSSLAIFGANLFAKAVEIGGSQDKEPDIPESLLKDLVDALRVLYALKASPAPAIDEIKAIGIQLHQLPSGEAAQLVPYQALPYHFPAADRKFQARKVSSAYAFESAYIESLRTHEYPVLTHPYSKNGATLPKYREIKQRLREGVAEGNLSSVTSELAVLAEAAPLQRDYLELASACLSSLSEMRLLVEICAGELARAPHAFTAFPMRSLVSHIESNQLADLDSLIVTESYVRNIDSSKDYVLNETYEEFLRLQGVRRPTDLNLSNIEPAKRRVLLRDISTIDTMEFLGSFDGSNDVRAERIKILDSMAREDLISPERHKTEVTDILAQATVDNASAEFNAHRIDVDDIALKRKLMDEIHPLYAIYRAASDSGDENFIRLTDNDTTARAAVVGDKNTAILKLYNTFLHAFLFDENHGLDKNLSGEIRHGFFSNTMGAKLGDRHLLIETDQDGNPKPNEYWAQAYALVPRDLVASIDSNLFWFSEKFSELLSNAEQWMKVATESVEGPRVFNYWISTDDFEHLRSAADRAETSEDLLDNFLELAWNRTETHLATMRERINVDFRKQVDDLFVQLIDRLNDAKGSVALTELMTAVSQTRNDIREDISAITEWFRRSDSLEAKELSIQELITISIECYSKVRRIQVASEVPTTIGGILVMVDGRQRKGFLAALMNLYENCIRHSGYGTDTPISIRGTQDGEGWNLSITNPVRPDVKELLEDGALHLAQERISGKSYAGLARTEGGTGLRKVQNQLGQTSSNFQLSIDLQDHSFVARIDHAQKNFVS